MKNKEIIIPGLKNRLLQILLTKIKMNSVVRVVDLDAFIDIIKVLCDNVNVKTNLELTELKARDAS